MDAKDLEEFVNYLETEGLDFVLIKNPIMALKIPGLKFTILKRKYLESVNEIYKEIVRLSKENNCNQDFVKRFEEG